jgi:diaminohydroxyphosphoribosylaminopyrimidine deaminase/5-amino-6-(5-phosphoribosylamino)uracil reductase
LPDGEAFAPVLRVVLDARLDAIPRDAHLLDGSTPTLVVHAEGTRAGDDRFARVELAAVPVRDGRLDLAAVLGLLADRGVNEVQVEAGPTLCGALFEGGFVDELLLYVAPMLLGDGARALLRLPPLAEIAASPRLRVVEQRQVGDDWRLLLRK